MDRLAPLDLKKGVLFANVSLICLICTHEAVELMDALFLNAEKSKSICGECMVL